MGLLDLLMVIVQKCTGMNNGPLFVATTFGKTTLVQTYSVKSWAFPPELCPQGYGETQIGQISNLNLMPLGLENV